MSLFGLFGGRAAEGTLSGAAKVVGAVGKVVDDLFTSDEERAKAAFDMANLEMEPSRAQWKINMVEAGHRSMFVAGWRPGIAWVCGIAMAFHFLVHPFWTWIAEIFGFPVPPDIEWQELSVVLMGILGLGGLRTYEKNRGVSK